MSLTNDALLRVFRQGNRLEGWDAALVAELSAHEMIAMRDQLIGVEADTLFIILEGWVCGYQMVGDGRRQIHCFHMAGDIPNLSRLIVPGRGSHHVALNHCRLGLLRASALREVCRKSPAIAGAVASLLATEVQIAQQWIANLGGRRSVARMAHLLCELTARADTALGHKPPVYAIPLTQTDLGDALGLSTVHTNRVLQELRALNLIELTAGHLVIPDRERLAALAGFDPAYLHLPHAPVTV